MKKKEKPAVEIKTSPSLPKDPPIIEEDEFRAHLLTVPGFEKLLIDDNDQLVWIIRVGKEEVSFEVSVERKKIICKIFNSKVENDVFEFTLKQFKTMLYSNTTKKALKSEEEKIVEKAAKREVKRATKEPKREVKRATKEPISDTKPVRRRGSDTKAKTSGKPSKKGK